MKLKSLLVALALCLSFSVSKAQNTQGESVVSAQVGYSLVFNFIETTLDAFDDITTNGTPAMQISFDHGLTDKFSIGAVASYQMLGADFKDTFRNAQNQVETDNVSAKLARYNLAVRPLFHYGNDESLDLYSGLRIGITGWTSSYESNQEDFEVGDFSGSRVSVGLVAFGMRYYFSESVGANFEVMMGSPYILSAGIAARF